MLRILVVENFSPWRRFVALALRLKPDLCIIAEAETGLAGIEKAIERQPDVVVLDIGLPDVNGIEVARRILEQAPKTLIIFLTVHTSHEMVEAALQTGARGYVNKAKAEKLLAALEAVLAGNVFVLL